MLGDLPIHLTLRQLIDMLGDAEHGRLGGLAEKVESWVICPVLSGNNFEQGTWLQKVVGRLRALEQAGQAATMKFNPKEK